MKNVNTKQQSIINTIIEEVKSGKLVPQSYAIVATKRDEKIEKSLRASLLEMGQLYPITITIEGVDTENPVAKVVKGNKKLQIINQLREEGLLKFEPDIEYRELSELGVKEFYAASTFILEGYTKFQKAMFGAKHLYGEIREVAEANQKANALTTDTHIDTCKLIGEKVGCCDRIVRLAEMLLREDEWFYEFIYSEKNELPLEDAREYIYLVDHIKKAKILSAMKEMYAREKAEAEKQSETEVNIKDEKLKDDLRRAFKKAAKSLYRRARAKVENSDPETRRRNAQKSIASVTGNQTPGDGSNQPEKYVNSYGKGKHFVTVDFKLPEALALAIHHACAQYDIDIRIDSAILVDESPSKQEVAA